MRHLLILVTLLASITPARADRALTFDDAVAIARAHNRELVAQKARLDQAAVGVDQALAALLPTLVVQGKYTHNYKEVALDLSQQNAGLFALVDILKATSGNPTQNSALNAYEQAVAAATGTGKIVLQKQEQLDFVGALTVPLVVPYAYPALDAAKKSFAASKATLSSTEASVLIGVAAAFYAAAGTDTLLEARRHAIEVAKKTVENAQARLEAGVVNRVEVTRAQIALLRAEQAERETVDLQANAYRGLSTILLLREPFHVVTGDEPTLPSDSAETLVQSALKLRPEFVAIERSLDAIGAQESSAKWRWAPTLSGFGNIRAFNYPGFAGDNYAWAIGLQVDWLLYDGGLRDVARKLAAAQKRENEQRLLQLRDNITDELYNARRGLETKRRALDTARRQVELAKETLDLVRVQHDAGTATQLDLLQAQDALVGSEVAVAQARFDLQLSDLQLKRSAGLFPR